MPILHYGSEIWGFNEAKEVERVHVEFCKGLLRLHRNTPGIAARGELGRLPLKTNRYIGIINFWLRILKQDHDRLTKQAYHLQLGWVESDTKCWALEVKRLLMVHGFGEAWYNQGVGDVSIFKNLFKRRCRDIETQNWHSAVNSMDRLKYYKVFKSSLNKEKYVDIIDKEQMAALTNFRCNSLPLRALTGYMYEKIPRENCICLICHSKEIEDEYHFFLECPAFRDLRCTILPRFLYVQPSKLKFTEYLKMSTEPTLRIITTYLNEALKKRATIISK